MGFEVVADDLVAHASHLDGLSDRLKTVVSAATTASMDDGAFGLLCAFMPLIVNPMEDKAHEALSASVEGVHTIGDNIRAAAKAYGDGDDTQSAPFTKFLADASPIIKRR
ncbi:Excreted virulence factor EspC, type VII ESX diderm [Amycolatopsis xylanica]|uniref:Excreted virulence factor EspC, type VII ESX diderm n=1 Tax=Amycolatopsis xylanica TaxID=589385 RepID=A0A1H3CP23_9PSEU|nr:type VII secretion target [Amycolatopsis xylanica]SDX55877.1 Excreted virulence factor EspC, type VII ESX diderm [Amycolatopsis xylanica]